LLNKYLNADDDWIESLRLYLYPKLHEPLSGFGDSIGVRLYATGGVGGNQYVGTLSENEEVIEKELDERAVRNPIACLKTLPDGRVSEGSWVLLHDENPALIEPGMQLHLTMFDREDGEAGREIYAHYEDDWRTAPLAHLRGKNFNPKEGVSIATEYFNDETYLVFENQ